METPLESEAQRVAELEKWIASTVPLINKKLTQREAAKKRREAERTKRTVERRARCREELFEENPTAAALILAAEDNGYRAICDYAKNARPVLRTILKQT